MAIIRYSQVLEMLGVHLVELIILQEFILMPTITGQT